MRDVVACTVVAKNYIPQARVLARTLAEHHPGSRLYVLLADDPDGVVPSSHEPFHLVRIEDLGHEDVVRPMTFYYDLLELSCALRPFLHDYVWRKTGAPQWFFLDPDIMIMHSLEELSETLGRSSILLSAHRSKPVSHAIVPAFEAVRLRTGLYQGGFLGVKSDDQTGAFLDWFKARLRFFGFKDKPGQFVEQLWLNLIPLYFRASVLKDPRINFGHYNMFEAELSVDKHQRFTVNGRPLLFAHFSTWRLPLHAPQKVLSFIEHEVDREKVLRFWTLLTDQYRRKLIDNGFHDLSTARYAFDYFASGERITPAMRRCYFLEVTRGEAVGDPFENYRHFAAKIGRVRPLLRRGGKLLMRPIARLLATEY